MGLFETNLKTTEGTLSNLETPEERKSRIRSLFITHISMFLSGFGNAIIYIGMFPYIQAVSCFINISIYCLAIARHFGEIMLERCKDRGFV